MSYQEFRDLWHAALQAAHLQIPYPIGPTEQINLRDMSRSYELIIYGGANPKCEPFHLITTIEWDWDAVLSARYETMEEEMLMQILVHPQPLPKPPAGHSWLAVGAARSGWYRVPAHPANPSWLPHGPHHGHPKAG